MQGLCACDRAASDPMVPASPVKVGTIDTAEGRMDVVPDLTDDERMFELGHRSRTPYYENWTVTNTFLDCESYEENERKQAVKRRHRSLPAILRAPTAEAEFIVVAVSHTFARFEWVWGLITSGEIQGKSSAPKARMRFKGNLDQEKYWEERREEVKDWYKKKGLRLMKCNSLKFFDVDELALRPFLRNLNTETFQDLDKGQNIITLRSRMNELQELLEITGSAQCKVRKQVAEIVIRESGLIRRSSAMGDHEDLKHMFSDSPKPSKPDFKPHRDCSHWVQPAKLTVATFARSSPRWADVTDDDMKPRS